MMFLFDTNVISELFRSRPNAGVVDLTEEVKQIYISAVTIEEIFYGLFAKPIPGLLEEFEVLLDTKSTVLPVGTEIAKIAGEIRGQLQTQGRTRAQSDMLIAATARHHEFTIVTRNVKDFKLCGIPVLNPFT